MAFIDLIDLDLLSRFKEKIIAEIPPASSETPVMDGTASAGSASAWAHGDHVHPTDSSRAPLTSPAFTGTPTAPTASDGTNTTQIATTAFVQSAVAADVDSIVIKPTLVNDNGTYSLTFAEGDLEKAEACFLNGGSVNFVFGTLSLATCSFQSPVIVINNNRVQFIVNILQYNTGDNTLVYMRGIWNYLHPTSVSISRWQISLTHPAAASSNPEMDGTATPGSSTDYARGDHVHPTDTTRAPIVSPNFSGIPTAPTAYTGSNNIQIANTEFVQAAIVSALGDVSTFGVSIVSALPSSGENSTIYFVSNSHGVNDIYDEYMYINNAWEKIGSTAVDLTDYVKTNDLAYVAFTGDYDNLNNKPSIPSNTSDLNNDSGFITVTSIPSKVSQLTNDSGYITISQVPTELPTVTSTNNGQALGVINGSWSIMSVFDGNYNSLTSKPTIPPATVVTQTITSGIKIGEVNGVALFAPSYTNADGISY